MNQLFEETAGVLAISELVNNHAEGRTNGHNLFSPVPIDDPHYVTHTAAGCFILHFVWLPLLAICTVPPLIIGAIPFVAAIALLAPISHTAAIIVGIVSVSLYLKYIVWKLTLCKIVGGLFDSLF